MDLKRLQKKYREVKLPANEILKQKPLIKERPIILYCNTIFLVYSELLMLIEMKNNPDSICEVRSITISLLITLRYGIDATILPVALKIVIPFTCPMLLGTCSVMLSSVILISCSVCSAPSNTPLFDSKMKLMTPQKNIQFLVM